MSFETDITEVRKIHELMGKVDKDEVARHLWGKPYDQLTDEQKALLDKPAELAEAKPKKGLFKPASDADISTRPIVGPVNKKKVITVDIFELINVEDLNEVLDSALMRDGVTGLPMGITYSCLDVTAGGFLNIEAEFELDET